MSRFDPVLIRTFDVLLSGILLVVSFPVLLLALLLSAMFIGIPPVYVSQRVGEKGKLFRHIKIKSMLPGREIGRIFMEQDRLNRCGRFLRDFHLDELPELWHIFRGQMSFVGPRPLPPRFLEGLETDMRERVPPGWTGPAQLILLKKGRLNKHLQIRLDNRYVLKRSFVYNLKILMATGRFFLTRKELDLRSDSTSDRIRFKEKNL